MKFPKVKNPFTVIGIVVVVILLVVAFFQGEEPAEMPATLPAVSPTPHPSAAFVPTVQTSTPSPALSPAQDMTEEPAANAPEASGEEILAVEAAKVCNFIIRCDALVGNDVLAEGKKELVPSDGIIFAAQDIPYSEGENVWDVLCRLTRQHGIYIEYTKAPASGGVYIEGIHNLHEFDGGSGSGWLYYVNGAAPRVSCSQYVLSPGDTVEFFYTCNYGKDY